MMTKPAVVYVISLLIIPAITSPAGAQVMQGAPARAESVVVTPGADYRAGVINSFLFGAHYRALWTTPLKVPLLRLDTTARGLRVLKRGGSMQTKSLR
ncbi:MAG: hypothetical protein DMD26_09710, partial [Gemmatimonadetes bacterium]